MAESKVIISAEDKTAAAFRSATKNMEAFAGGLMGMQGKIVALLGGAGLGALIKSQIDYGDSLDHTREKLGIAVDKLSAYQYAARTSNSSNEELNAGLARLSVSIQEAIVNKGGEAARTFKALGVAVTDSNGKARDTGAIFEDIAKKFSASADGSGKTAAAQALMGKSAANLIPTMNDLAGAMAEAKKNGAIVPPDFAKKAREFNDGVDRMKENTASLARELGIKLLPAINSVIEAMTRLVSGGSLVKHDMRPQLQAQADLMIKLAKEATDKGNKDLAEYYKGQARFFLNQMVKTNEELKQKLYEGDDKKKPDPKKPTINVESAEQIALREKLKQRADEIAKSLLSERDLEVKAYEDKLRDLDAYYKGKKGLDKEYQQTRELLKFAHEEKLTKIENDNQEKRRKFDELTAKQKYDTTKQIFGDLSSLMTTTSKKQFEIGKKAAIAEALVSTYLGAQHAFTQGTKAGGMWVGVAAAAAATIAGMVRVNNIKNQQFQGGGSASTGTFSANPYTGQPTAPPGLPQGSQQSQTVVNLTIAGNVVGNQQFIDDTAAAIADAVNTRDLQLIGPNSRNASVIREG